MKRSFVVFWKRNLAFAKLAIISNLEYRFNFFIDSLVQPVLTCFLEVMLWLAIFKGANKETIAGFSQEYYLGYAIWAAFFSRIATSWMYEARMIEEIGSGSINSIIVRPMSFYEYYLSQLLGYKFIITVTSLFAPVIICLAFNLPTDISRVPMAVLLSFYFLIFIHSISFLLSTLAFHFTKINSVTAVKNMILWVMMGDQFPLDLLPEKIAAFFISLPFSSGVFLPVAYITHRVEVDKIFNGFISVTVGLLVVNLIGGYMWRVGLKSYSGTGA